MFMQLHFCIKECFLEIVLIFIITNFQLIGLKGRIRPLKKNIEKKFFFFKFRFYVIAYSVLKKI